MDGLRLKNEARLILLDYLNEEYDGTFFITFHMLDEHKGLEPGTAKKFLKTLLAETGWEVDRELQTIIKLKRKET